MMYTNAQKLAAVLSTWARPAIAELAAGRLTQLPFMKSVQAMLVSSGIVGQTYNIGNELKPFASNIVNAMFTPLLVSYMSRVPDDTLPALAHSIVDTAMEQPMFSILDGLVEFSQDDMLELKDLLDKNLPIEPAAKINYEVIK
ncbi:MAG: hypothetical protein UH685_06105 [Bacteroidaceae bacterium]|nr:hypothetical protein [Bacteroidaceae bacterium]